MYPDFHEVTLSEDCKISLPKVTCPDTGFTIYSFMPIGQVSWNEEAAKSLAAKIAKAKLSNVFDDIIVPEAKPFEMAGELTKLLRHDSFVPIRKKKKLYMGNPTSITVKSISTEDVQTFWLGEDHVKRLKGKRICVIEDVISTGGTMEAIFGLAEQVGFTITLIACVLTEGEERQEFRGVPIVSLDHIPLPL